MIQLQVIKICRTMTQLQVILQNHPYIPTETELCTHVVGGHQDLQSTTFQTIAKLYSQVVN